MDFHFTAEERKLIDQIHEFAVNEVAPLAAEIDEQERFPEDAWRRLGEMGMTGVCYPKKYGGAIAGASGQSRVDTPFLDKILRLCYNNSGETNKTITF